MTEGNKTQIPQGAASTVALENVAEAIARGTLRALDERRLVSASGGTVKLPIGDGSTVLGIVIPPCEPGEHHFGVAGLCCDHHIILGIIIIPGLDRHLGTPVKSGDKTLG